MALYPQLSSSQFDADAVTTVSKVTIAVGTTSIKILSANPNRKGFSLLNNSGKTVYFDYDQTVTITDCAFSLVNNAYYVDDIKWRGDVWAITSGANTNIRVREFTS
jgi:isocitrate dehydrogenase kinase/phosphatase